MVPLLIFLRSRYGLAPTILGIDALRRTDYGWIEAQNESILRKHLFKPVDLGKIGVNGTF